jgi:hypothetical protein
MRVERCSCSCLISILLGLGVAQEEPLIGRPFRSFKVEACLGYQGACLGYQKACLGYQGACLGYQGACRCFIKGCYLKDKSDRK